MKKTMCRKLFQAEVDGIIRRYEKDVALGLSAVMTVEDCEKVYREKGTAYIIEDGLIYRKEQEVE